MSNAEKRYQFAAGRLRRFSKDIEIHEKDWKAEHQTLSERCWVWEELARDAVRNLELWERAELDLRLNVLQSRGAPELVELERQFYDLLRDLVRASSFIDVRVDRIVAEYGEFEGAVEFREALTRAQDMLTPDSEFFTGTEERAKKLAILRDQALEQDGDGRSEPWPG